MLRSPLQKALALLGPDVVPLLLALTRLAPLQVALDLVQDVIEPAHLPQPVHCCHFLRVLLIGRVGGFSIEYVLLLALIDELQFLELLGSECEQVLSEIGLFDACLLLFSVVLAAHAIDDAIIFLLFLRADLVQHL